MDAYGKELEFQTGLVKRGGGGGHEREEVIPRRDLSRFIAGGEHLF